MPQAPRPLDRRSLLLGAAAVGLAGLSTHAHAADTRLPFNGAPDERALSAAFPQKGQMILQRTRPPLLETPWEVFDKGVFTPNDQFFVRWHWAVIPEQIDAAKYRLSVHGLVNQAQSLTLADILALPRVELAAINQCSGNSRGFFGPRVAGGQWANGAMGNAKWVGVRLRDVLDRAGIKPGAVAVRFNGLDEPVVAEAPDFMKSLDIDHARDGEVMLALPDERRAVAVLNGFPLRLVVAGLVFDLLGQDGQRHRGAGPPGRPVLDEERLPDPQNAACQRSSPARPAFPPSRSTAWCRARGSPT